MEQKAYSLTELMALLDLSHRATFQKNYLTPALEAGVIERTPPDKPKSPKQKYKLKNYWTCTEVDVIINIIMS